MAPRLGFGEHSHLGGNANDTEGEVPVGEPVLHSCEQHRMFKAFKSSVSWKATSTLGEAEEAEADEDVEDIVMEVPDQPIASASSSSAASAKKKKLTALERCTALNLVYGTGRRV